MLTCPPPLCCGVVCCGVNVGYTVSAHWVVSCHVRFRTTRRNDDVANDGFWFTHNRQCVLRGDWIPERCIALKSSKGGHISVIRAGMFFARADPSRQVSAGMHQCPPIVPVPVTASHSFRAGLHDGRKQFGRPESAGRSLPSRARGVRRCRASRNPAP